MRPILALIVLFASGCAAEPDPLPPEMGGTYTVVVGGSSWDNACPPELSLLDIYAFVGMDGVIITGPMTVAQEGATLTVNFTDCGDLAGGVGTAGDFSFTGECSATAFDLAILGSGLHSEDTGIHNLEGSLQVQVDWDDGSGTGTGPDGAFDCTVTGDLRGSF